MRLLKANETNMYALTPFSYDWPGATKREGEDLSWCITDIPFPWCNVAFKARLEPACADRAIWDFAEIGRKRNVPVCWWIGSETKPADLAGRLKSHGFLKRADTALMAADLYGMKEDRLLPHDLTIEQVENKDALRLWCSVAATGFAIPPSAEPFLFEWLSTAIDIGMPLRFYLARMRGLPVATSMLLLAEGVAGLYFIATVPAARREGIGHAVTLAPLREARRMGHGVGVLQASRMGEAIYRRIGFRTYGTMTSYIRMHGVS
jgi:hypothetical protein